MYIRFLALPPSWILQADLVLALPRAPEFHDYVLRAGCRSYALLTRKADPALTGLALLRINRNALSPAPDLACGAGLLEAASRAASTSRGTFRDDAGRSYLAGDVGHDRLLDRLGRRLLTRSVFADCPARVVLNRRRCMVLGGRDISHWCGIGLVLHAKMLGL